jgi:ribosomal protein S24E
LKMETIENKENSLLNRREVKVIAEADKNPSFLEAVNIIASEFKVNGENIAIKIIKGKFGRNTFLISDFIYNSKEEKEKFEKVKGKKEEKAGENTATETQTQTVSA